MSGALNTTWSNSLTICPGPNIANFSKVASLQEMTDHIYGRANVLETKNRPHMFIKELQLYMDYLREQIRENIRPDKKFTKYCETFSNNLLQGISYYQQLISQKTTPDSWKSLLEPLANFSEELEAILSQNNQLSEAYQEA